MVEPVSMEHDTQARENLILVEEGLVKAGLRSIRDILPKMDKANRINRVHILQKFASDVSKVVSPLCACGQGCSHCCHQAVEINTWEAKNISRVHNVAYKNAPMISSVMAMRDDYLGVPCPFLSQDGKCEIYEERPLACRTSFNLSDEASLCDLTKGMLAVPMLSTNDTTAVALHYWEGNWNDIRLFFPNGLKKAPF